MEIVPTQQPTLSYTITKEEFRERQKNSMIKGIGLFAIFALIFIGIGYNIFRMTGVIVSAGLFILLMIAILAKNNRVFSRGPIVYTLTPEGFSITNGPKVVQHAWNEFTGYQTLQEAIQIQTGGRSIPFGGILQKATDLNRQTFGQTFCLYWKPGKFRLNHYFDISAEPDNNREVETFIRNYLPHV